MGFLLTQRAALVSLKLGMPSQALVPPAMEPEAQAKQDLGETSCWVTNPMNESRPRRLEVCQTNQFSRGARESQLLVNECDLEG